MTHLLYRAKRALLSTTTARSMAAVKQTYSARAARQKSAVAKQLLEICERKQSNLALSADLSKKADLLRVVEAAAPYVCLVKTHIDIVEDFDEDLVQQLVALSKKHDFLIFEDRKFADIGSTVKLQYTAGVHKIASWAHIVNAHALPGDGIVSGLQSGLSSGQERGLLLIAELSSKGSLATGSYTNATVEMARRHSDFVIGFIAQNRVHELDGQPSGDDFLILTPGIGLDSTGDGLGQQYRTPEDAIGSRGSDIAIVGRGIYGSGSGRPSEEIEKEAKRYRDACWTAYKSRIA